MTRTRVIVNMVHDRAREREGSHIAEERGKEKKGKGEKGEEENDAQIAPHLYAGRIFILLNKQSMSFSKIR